MTSPFRLPAPPSLCTRGWALAILVGLLAVSLTGADEPAATNSVPTELIPSIFTDETNILAGAPSSKGTNVSNASSSATTNMPVAIAALPSVSPASSTPAITNTLSATTSTTNSPPVLVEAPTNGAPSPQPLVGAEAVQEPVINPALTKSQDLITSSNLVSKQDTNQAVAEAKFQAMLDEAWREKQEKNSKEAERLFIALLMTNAPTRIQRTALIELALLAQGAHQYARAQQIFADYSKRYPQDPSVPEVLLRQGLLYRQMEAPSLALAKFYAVMSTCLSLKLDQLEYYQRIVLQAQSEIADTYYFQGKYDAASDFLQRLLKLDNPSLNNGQILYKLVRSLSYQAKYDEVLGFAQRFLDHYSSASELAEVRFLMAEAYKKLGRNRDAMQQVLALLESQQSAASQSPETWTYWQQRTGNDIANQLYKEGDYVNALEIYLSLAKLNTTAAWQVPVWYQIGLVYERLQQEGKAAEMYAAVLARAAEIPPTANASLRVVLEMAEWRQKSLRWQTNAELAVLQFKPPLGSTNDISTPR